MITINKKTKIVLVVAVLGGALLVNMFLLFTGAFQGESINAVNASQYGSFIGGYIGTFVSCISVALLYLNLSNQNESLEYQRKAFEHQQKASELEKFENKFFELLKIHRENMSEVCIKERTGRKVFVSMFREYREVTIILKSILKKEKISLSKDDFTNISYLIFYYGVGPNSSRMLKDALVNHDKGLIEKIIKSFEDPKVQKEVREKRNFKYRPFAGHQSRLGHYYRHLYQSVMYVHKQDIEIDKYEYIKMLRAQLSTHEQALLYFNVQSNVGRIWDKDDLITKYALIKNIPKNFIDEKNEVDLKEKYPDLVFEWEDNVI